MKIYRSTLLIGKGCANMKLGDQAMEKTTRDELSKTFPSRGDRFWLVARNGRSSAFDRRVSDECRQFQFWLSPIFCHPYQYKIISDC